MKRFSSGAVGTNMLDTPRYTHMKERCCLAEVAFNKNPLRISS